MTDDITLFDPTIVNEDDVFFEVSDLLTEAGEATALKAAAINKVCYRLAHVDIIIADVVISRIAKDFKIKKAILNQKTSKHRRALEKEIKQQQSDVLEIDLPDDVEEAEARKNGFFASKRAYFFITATGLFKASNFVINPLYHIYSKTDNKRLIEIENEHHKKSILDISSKFMVSKDMFQQAVFGEGHYIFFGSGGHFIRIIDGISRNFPIANELRTLGWQREGFYAFANGIYNDAWQPVNNFGVTDHNSVKYFSPAFSCVYSEVREDDDEYENDRYFIFQQSKHSLGEWARSMEKVYGQNGQITVAYMIAACFRDLVYEKYKIFPHLFLFGEKQSGKSQLAWSLSNVFFNNLPAFNLNSGTQVGFFRRLSRVKNAVCWYDEYTNDIDEKRFQSLKSAYDGMGHEKGKMSKDNRTEITKVNSACCISGQYLPTRDDNALYTRSIQLNFEKRNYTAEAMANFDQLKQMELDGLSSIVCDVIKHRSIMEKHFTNTFAKVYDALKNSLISNSQVFDERLVRNCTCILTPIKISEEHKLYDVGYSYTELFNQCRDLISEMSTQISSSEAVSSFWNLVEYMLDTKQITHGEDFKIEICNHTVKLKNRRDVYETFDFTKTPSALIYFRFSKIHPIYMEAHRKQYGKNGVDLVSLMHYLRHHPTYLGQITSTRFTLSNTSAFVFNYEKMGLNLVRETIEDEERNLNRLDNNELTPKKDLPF